MKPNRWYRVVGRGGEYVNCVIANSPRNAVGQLQGFVSVARDGELGLGEVPFADTLKAKPCKSKSCCGARGES